MLGRWWDADEHGFRDNNTGEMCKSIGKILKDSSIRHKVYLLGRSQISGSKFQLLRETFLGRDCMNLTGPGFNNTISSGDFT